MNLDRAPSLLLQPYRERLLIGMHRDKLMYGFTSCLPVWNAWRFYRAVFFCLPLKDVSCTHGIIQCLLSLEHSRLMHCSNFFPCILLFLLTVCHDRLCEFCQDCVSRSVHVYNIAFNCLDSGRFTAIRPCLAGRIICVDLVPGYAVPVSSLPNMATCTILLYI